jgi:hypothetical protein
MLTCFVQDCMSISIVGVTSLLFWNRKFRPSYDVQQAVVRESSSPVGCRQPILQLSQSRQYRDAPSQVPARLAPINAMNRSPRRCAESSQLTGFVPASLAPRSFQEFRYFQASILKIFGTGLPSIESNTCRHRRPQFCLLFKIDKGKKCPSVVGSTEKVGGRNHQSQHATLTSYSF